MQQVWMSLKELDEKATKLKGECQDDLKLNLKLHRSDADIKKRQEQQQIDQYIISQRKLLDAGSNTEQNNISMAMKASLRDLMTKALHDQRAAFDEKMKQERTVLNQALSKFIEENDANIEKERAKVDFMIKQAWEQMDKGLENERSILNSLIGSLIQKEEVRGTIEKVEDRICSLTDIAKVTEPLYLIRIFIHGALPFRRKCTLRPHCIPFQNTTFWKLVLFQVAQYKEDL